MTEKEWEDIHMLMRMAERYAHMQDSEVVLKVYEECYYSVRKYCAKSVNNSK